MVELILGAIKKCIETLLDSKIEPELSLDFRDELGRTPLYNACYYGYFEVVRLLIEFQRENNAFVSLNVNAAVKVSERTPLHVAVRKGSLEIVQLLLTVKGININPEGRPSGRTQNKLIDNFQRFEHGRSSVLAPEKQDSILEDEGEEGMSVRRKRSNGSMNMSSPEFPMSPPGTRTPDSLSLSMSSSSSSLISIPRSSVTSLTSHIDDSIGFVAPSPSILKQVPGSLSKSSKVRPYTTLPAKKVKGGVHEAEEEEEDDLMPLQKIFPQKKRSQTDADGLASGDREKLKRTQTESDGKSGETNLKVVENQKTGRLEFVMKGSNDSPTGSDFDQIFMTPLAEACACYHTTIMKLLLLHGARDDKGLACRITHLLHRPHLMKLILSYHTVLKEGMETVGDYVEIIPQLELNWSHMKLPHFDGAWVGQEAEFYPLSPKDQGGEAEDCYASHSSELCNSLRAGPEVKVQFDAIVTVHLDNNQLHSVPIQLFQLQNVGKINLSGNKITEIPRDRPSQPLGSSPYQDEASGWTCPALTSLNLSKNELAHIPACVWTLPSLMRLYLSRNKLQSLLPEVGPAPEGEDLSLTLEVVDISSNRLEGKISRFLFELPVLRSLILSDNKITELPETLWGCESLHDLNVAGNQLTSLPWCEAEGAYRDTFSHSSFSQPVHLQQADKVIVGRAQVKAPNVDRNKSLYQRAPSTIKPLTTSQNVSSSMAVDKCDYSALRKLNLSRNKLSSFPEALGCFAPNLVELDVSKNPLKELDIQFLPHMLKKLTAKGCAIERFGTVITKAHQQQVRNVRWPLIGR
jgi:Leucine-rich repeat (LRR) protein